MGLRLRRLSVLGLMAVVAVAALGAALRGALERRAYCLARARSYGEQESEFRELATLTSPSDIASPELDEELARKAAAGDPSANAIVLIEQSQRVDGAVYLRRAMHCARMKSRFEAAARRPWNAVPPDEPFNPTDLLPDLNEIMHREPANARAHAHLGEVWYNKRQWGKALAELDEAIRINPDEERALNVRAWIHATCPVPGLRDGKRAVADASRACELDNPDAMLVLDTLAAAYAESGNFQSAVDCERRAIQGLAPEEIQRRELYEDRLRSFEAKRPIRTP
jgi:tetratricopeptide (TPR) repeat protein